MDGWTFSREARRTEAARETPIVVLSGVHDLSRKVEGLPVNGFVAKPFEYDELVSWLARGTAN
jgi:DNA-binding response OmpR family regulator